MPCAPINHLGLAQARTSGTAPNHPYTRPSQLPQAAAQTYSRKSKPANVHPHPPAVAPAVIAPPSARYGHIWCINCQTQSMKLNGDGTFLCENCFYSVSKQPQLVDAAPDKGIFVESESPAVGIQAIKDRQKHGAVNSQTKEVVNRIDGLIKAMLFDAKTRLPGLGDPEGLKGPVYNIWARMQFFWQQGKLPADQYPPDHIGATPHAGRFPYQIAAAIRLAVQEQVLLYANSILGRTHTRPAHFGKLNASVRVPTKLSIINHFDAIGKNHPGIDAALDRERWQYFRETYHKGLEQMPIPITRYDMLIINMFETLEHLKALIALPTDDERNKQYPIAVDGLASPGNIYKHKFITFHRHSKDRVEEDFTFFAKFDSKAKWDEVLVMGLRLFHAQEQVPLWLEIDHIAMAVALVFFAIMAVRRNVIPGCKKFISAIGGKQDVGASAIELHMKELKQLLVCWVPSIVPAGLTFPVLRYTSTSTLGDGISGYDGKNTSGIPIDNMAVSAARTIAENWEAIVAVRVRALQQGQSMLIKEDEMGLAKIQFARNEAYLKAKALEARALKAEEEAELEAAERARAATTKRRGSRVEAAGSRRRSSGAQVTTRQATPVMGLGITLSSGSLPRLDTGAGMGWRGSGLTPMTGNGIAAGPTADPPGTFTVSTNGSSFSMVPAAPAPAPPPAPVNDGYIDLSFYNYPRTPMARGESSTSTQSLKSIGSGTTYGSSMPNPVTPNSSNSGTPLTSYKPELFDVRDFPPQRPDEVYRRGILHMERERYVALERKKIRGRGGGSEVGEDGGNSESSVSGSATKGRKRSFADEGEEKVVTTKRPKASDEDKGKGKEEEVTVKAVANPMAISRLLNNSNEFIDSRPRVTVTGASLHSTNPNGTVARDHTYALASSESLIRHFETESTEIFEERFKFSDAWKAARENVIYWARKREEAFSLGSTFRQELESRRRGFKGLPVEARPVDMRKRHTYGRRQGKGKGKGKSKCKGEVGGEVEEVEVEVLNYSRDGGKAEVMVVQQGEVEDRSFAEVDYTKLGDGDGEGDEDEDGD